ncbi:hypothetical protein [Streptacidiphilus sp. EB129]|uniref:hypothetical protein n=1 Tax=Streptacidiphilus sp. EB129 TaxID=3156262 RepID=UPI003512AD8F
MITGIVELGEALEAMAARVEAATAEAVKLAAGLVGERARANLSLTSHERGTPTPSAPNQPPSMISGTLRDNWTDPLPVSDGAGTWVCTLAPTTVYAGIQEYGGWTGRNHASYLPPRPYLRPAVDDLLASGLVEDAFVRAWTAAIHV